MINGGPQSGKTMIAASLACMFAQRNKQTSKGKVLVCAPNETSLHNIVGKWRNIEARRVVGPRNLFSLIIQVKLK